MARFTHTPLTPPHPDAGAPAADSADLVMTACDATEKQEVLLTGRELLVFHNTGVSARTVTVTSVADTSKRRTGDVAAYSIGAGEYAVIGPFPQNGWMQSANSKLYFEASHADVKAGVIKLPTNI